MAREGKGRETFQELTPTVWVREFVDLKKDGQVGLLKERCSGETCPWTGPATACADCVEQSLLVLEPQDGKM